MKGDSTKGSKTSKERVTIMLACSATGEKRKGAETLHCQQESLDDERHVFDMD